VLFTEPTFLFVFLPLLLAMYYVRLKPEATIGNWLLVIASLIFYARGAGSFTTLIMVSIAVNYAAALAIDRLRDTPAARWVLGVTVALNLASLATFKYAGFLVTNVNALLGTTGFGSMPVPNVLLPIGISFFTFHSISYVVDVYRRDAAAQKRPVEAALYLLLFPQLIAGPIIRYREIAAQLSSRSHRLDVFAHGVRRFIVGLAKKMLIANIVAIPADRIFAMPAAELTAAHAWLAVSCYTLQIYFDFSGYSDMAIGLGAMFGFRFPENFRYPYIAASIQEFWRRWHITLSAWFRDYLYVPLGGNRVSQARLYGNLLTVFFLCGLWHGASWTFVVWGLLHGLFLVLERLGLGRALPGVASPIRHAYVLAVVMVGWVFFRADSLGAAAAMLRAMAGFGAAQPTIYAASWYLTPELLLALIAGAIGSTPIVHGLARWFGVFGPTKVGPYVPIETGPAAGGGRLQPAFGLGNLALLVLLFASVMLIAARTYNPFIYFRF
jgi:alginate O-acetyltransferase complex protein AlgI